MAYMGFVRPLMEYCPLVWSGAALSHLARFDREQNRALSLIGPGAMDRMQNSAPSWITGVISLVLRLLDREALVHAHQYKSERSL